jgi:hypothetical protein
MFCFWEKYKILGQRLGVGVWVLEWWLGWSIGPWSLEVTLVELQFRSGVLSGFQPRDLIFFWD